MKTHMVEFKNDGNQIWHIDLGGSLPYKKVKPGSKMQVTVDDENIFYKYDKLRWDGKNKLHVKKNPNYRIPKEDENTLVLHIKNEKEEDATTEILIIDGEKYRLIPGIEEYITFDKILDAEVNEIIYKEIIINEPITREVDNGYGGVRVDKMQSIDYIKRDPKVIQEIQGIRGAKRRKRLGLE